MGIQELLGAGFILSWVASILTIPSILVQREGRPLAALSWLLAIFAFPPLTLLAWWLFGRTHLTLNNRRRQRRIAQFQQTLRANNLSEHIDDELSIPLEFMERIPEDMRSGVQLPVSPNAVSMLFDATVAYPAFEQAIQAATDFIHLEFYIWQPDQIGTKLRDLLIQKAKAGVEIRLLYDSLGSTALPRRFFKPLIDAGAQVRAFLPIQLFVRFPTLNFRNHRKLLIIDGTVGFIGGLNIGDEYLQWHDMAARMRGPVVDQLQEVFAQDWFVVSQQDLASSRYFNRWRCLEAEQRQALMAQEECQEVTCATIASGPTQQQNAIYELLFAAINLTKDRLWLMTPYFLPDAAILTSLRAAIYRGVEIRLMLPAQNDLRIVRWASRAYYRELLEVGVRIFEYDGMLHAKATIFDDRLTFMGSANMDVRSFRLNFEANTFLRSTQLNAQMAALFEQDCTQRCTEIKLEEFAKRSYLRRAADSMAHLLSPLL